MFIGLMVYMYFMLFWFVLDLEVFLVLCFLYIYWLFGVFFVYLVVIISLRFFDGICLIFLDFLIGVFEFVVVFVFFGVKGCGW